MNGSVALVPGANTVEENSELTITATPNEGYNLASLTVNGEDITSGETHTVTGATEISVCLLYTSVDSFVPELGNTGGSD